MSIISDVSRFEEMAEKYTDNLCGQCWNCANRNGYRVFQKNGKPVKLPRCEATDKYMFEVYSMPCDYFKERE